MTKDKNPKEETPDVNNEAIDEASEDFNEDNKLKDEILRLKAEFQNFQKRMQVEKSDSVKFANSELIMNLLPVLDNFKRAAQHAPQSEDKTISNWEVGIQAIARQFEDTLQSFGVIEIETVPGQNFDPRLHEAISHEKSDQENDTIARVVEIGYMYKDKVLRPAKVKISV